MAISARPGFDNWSSTTSEDGTRIGYRSVGTGPGLVVMHGAMQASQSYRRLATALAGDLTVHVPDRRGRGRSGPHGDHYGIDREEEDLRAVLAATGSPYVFGLSSGALICLAALRRNPSIRRAALYEPPLPVPGAMPSRAWVARHRCETDAGRTADALITVGRGTRTWRLARILPRPVLRSFLTPALAQDAPSGQVPLRDLVPTAGHDASLVAELDGSLASYREIGATVLMLSGSRSPRHLRRVARVLAGTVPGAEHIELSGADHSGPDDSGRPDQVAELLRAFYLRD